MLLTKKKRQEYLQYLGFYTGKIDGKEGPLTKKAYKKLQDTYFIRKKDKDGKYGKNTDTLLRNAYKVKYYCKDFELKEFMCKCKGKYCTGYPAELDKDLLIYTQDVRDENGATKIESGLRCTTHNKKVGGVAGSKHTKGKAVDFQNAKVCKSMTTKKKFINEYILKTEANYSYTNGYARTKKKTTYPVWKDMSNSVHIDVK